MPMVYDTVIIGGGLAGLTSAIHLAQSGVSVLVVEKQPYPHHKVCGEYVSNEVLSYLNYLGIDVHGAGAVAIDTFQISNRNGKTLTAELPLGGFGLSRFCFDALLFQRAKALGVAFCFDTVTEVRFAAHRFTITTVGQKSFTCPIAIGAFGKRSVLDKRLNRNFSKQKSSWLAFKCHYRADFPNNMVALHPFHGGYGGLSKTELGTVNFCYLTNYRSFQRHKTFAKFNERVVSQNPNLKAFLQHAEPEFDSPMSIAQISFAPKEAVVQHVLMVGDSAGLIHPLCGNGMAMAIHGAQLAAATIMEYLGGKLDRHALETHYRQLWKSTFADRLRMGRYVQSLLLNDTAAMVAMNTLARSKKLVRSIIRQTHGKPILV